MKRCEICGMWGSDYDNWIHLHDGTNAPVVCSKECLEEAWAMCNCDGDFICGESGVDNIGEEFDVTRFTEMPPEIAQEIQEATEDSVMEGWEVAEKYGYAIIVETSCYFHRKNCYYSEKK